MKKMKYLSIIMIFLFTMLVGCGASKEETIKQSQTLAQETFNQKKLAYTKTIYGIKLYLPEDFKIVNETENNIIFAKGRHEYILFVNPQETPDSKVAFETLKTGNGEKTLNSFTDKDRFGYFSTSPIDGDEYELVVGIGGVKLSTKTKLGDMAENTKIMMEIANSVEYKEEKTKEAIKTK